MDRGSRFHLALAAVASGGDDVVGEPRLAEAPTPDEAIVGHLLGEERRAFEEPLRAA